jgi:hypothetical protein
MNKIKKIGLLVDQLEPTQILYQFVKTANKFLLTNDWADFCIFYRNFGALPLQPNFGTFSAAECFAYDGFTVATDLQGAQQILRYPGPNRRSLYFYLNDLEWLTTRDKFSYEALASIYLNPKLNLICRSEPHAEIVRAVWKEPKFIIENGDAAKFAELL